MDSLFSWNGLLPYLIAAIAVIAIVWFVRRARRKPQLRSRYTEALNALLEGNEDRALEDLRQTVLVERTNIDAFLRLGNLLRKKGATA